MLPPLPAPPMPLQLPARLPLTIRWPSLCLLIYLGLSPTLLWSAPPAEGAPADKEQLDFFESRIRPQLVQHCYACHSQQAASAGKLRGGLLLDSRDGSRRGGDSGPAVVPGKPAESLLIAALQHESFEMPPKGKLPAAVIADFVKWVEWGAADPREGSNPPAVAEIDIESGRQHWAFQRLQKAGPPVIRDAGWARTGIDRFVRSRQEAAELAANPTADPRTLIRRAYFDLLGLPPRPEEIEQFEREAESDLEQAWQQLIDRLLASEHYGERWGRHWLDIVRFAESNGYAFDLDRPNAWRYRDFVIRALNQDLPYDQFIRLQLAGDLLRKPDPATPEEAAGTIDQLAATGFLVAGPFTSQQTQKERERSRYEQLDDIVATVGSSLLGLTVGCSRCHSHKYDPLPIDDYYRFAACFAEVGSAETDVITNPDEYGEAKRLYDAAHAPLVQARGEYESRQLAERFETWVTATKTATESAAEPLAVTLEPWYHVGPFPASNFEEAFRQAFEPESEIKLEAGYRDGQLKWVRREAWSDGVVHNTLEGENAANYLYRVIRSPEARNLKVSLGSDDGFKLWVNGQLVADKPVQRGAAADQESVQVQLRPGENQLLLKIVNGGGPSGFYFQARVEEPFQLAGTGPWYHLGPFQSPDAGQRNLNATYAEVFAPERERDFDAQRTYGADGQLRWVAHPEWADATPHADVLPGTECANYLYRTVELEQPQVVSLSLGSDDAIKLWVNGREVLAKQVRRDNAAAGQETVTVQLAAGRNELLMKIVNGGGKSGFYFQPLRGQPPKEIADLLALPAEQRKPPQRAKLLDWYKGFDLPWLQLERAVTLHAIDEPQPQLAKVFAAKVRGNTYQFGENTYKVFHLRRGNADNKGDQAVPGFLRVLTEANVVEQHWLSAGESEGCVEPQAVHPRLALAGWLADPERGAGHLLARVAVNRLWYHHFGRGLVATTGDFGTRGAQPTHPELLDWLASQLIDSGWRLKPLHRLIMTSSVYMQGNQPIGDGPAKDPDNLLLWRRESRRLDAEAIRDALLAVSGQLDSRMYGPGTLDVNSRRRSVYFTVKRSQLIPFLQLFNAPDAMQAVGSREESTVAPQALALLNSPQVRGLAVQFAAQVRPDPQQSLGDSLRLAWRRAYGRPPSDEALGALQQFVQAQAALRGGGQAEQLAFHDACHLLLCANEFIYVD